MAEVVLSQLSKVFPGGTIGLDQVDLTVADGEFVVLVGPSGCGKSTLLRVVAGLEDATGGTVSIDGEVVNDVSPKERDIAMVFQNYALYPHMTVDDNLAFSLKVRRVPGPGNGGRHRARTVAGTSDGTQTQGAVRWTTATGGDGPRHGTPPQGPADGRTIVQSGRQAAGRDAR
jgi:ABC-type sugar transport system ATPase subunit